MQIRREDVLRYLQGQAAAQEWIDSEQARRLPGLTRNEALEEFEDLCRVWYRVWRAPEVDGDHLSSLLRVRRVFQLQPR